MRNPRSIVSTCLALTIAFGGCENGPDGRDGPALTPEDLIVDVVTFDIDRINEDGLVGPPDGLRSVMYEFCVPSDSISMATVQGIDPTLELHPGAPGRIGCTDGQVLCIGHTLQPEWKATLARLAALEFVTRIDESFME